MFLVILGCYGILNTKLVLSVMGVLLILGTVTNVMFTRAEKSSDRRLVGFY